MKNKYLTKVEVERMFKEEFKENLIKWNTMPTDKPAKRMAWNNFVDYLKRDGEVSEFTDWTQPRFIQS